MIRLPGPGGSAELKGLERVLLRTREERFVKGRQSLLRPAEQDLLSPVVPRLESDRNVPQGTSWTLDLSLTSDLTAVF